MRIIIVLISIVALFSQNVMALSGSMWFDPSTIYEGDSSTLRWSSDADHCVWEGTQVPPSGSAPNFTVGQTTSATCYENADRTGASVSDSATLTVLSLAKPNMTSPGSTDSNGSYTVGWSSVSGADTYKAYEGSSQIYSGSSTSTSVSGKSVGTYCYKAKACNGSACSDYSSQRCVDVAPSTPSMIQPTGSNITDTDGNYLVDWNSPSGSTSYRLYENGNQVYSGGSSSRNYSGKPNGQYCYKARACYNSACSGYSAERCYTVDIPPPAPSVTLNESNNAEFPALETTNFTASTSGTSVNDVKFYFSPVGDAGEYLLSNGTLVGGQWQGTNTPQAGDYDVWARAWYDNSSLTEDSASVRIHVYARPGVPGNITGPNETTNGAYLISWAAASGSYTRHVLEERFNGGAWNTLLNGNSLSLNASNQPLGTYDYRAYACQSTICGNKTPVKTVNVLPPAPSVTLNENNGAEYPALETTNFTASVSGTSVNDVKFYFSPVGDAGEYLLSNGTLVGGQWQGTNTPQADDYDVWARAWYNNSSLTQDSSSVRIHVYARPGVPGNITGPNETTNGAYLISWAAASGSYTRHVLEERFNGGAWNTLLNGNSLSLNASNQPLGTYEYRAYACQSTICGNKTPVKTVNVLPPAPSVTLNENNGAEYPALETTNFTASTSGTSVNDVKFYFSPVGDSGEYLLSDGTLVGGQWQGTNTPQADDYDVWARAWYHNSSLTQDSPSVRIHVYARPGVPGNITGPNETTNGAYLISWAAASGSYTRHVLEERFNGGTWTTLLDGNSLSLNASNQPLGTYEYRAYACQSTICGNKTPVKTVNVLPPAPSVTLNENNGAEYPALESTNFTASVSGTSVNDVKFYFSPVGDAGEYLLSNGTLVGGQWQGTNTPQADDYDVWARAWYHNSSLTQDSTSVRIHVYARPGVPGNIVGPNETTNGAYLISWAAASGSYTRHILEERFNGGAWTTLLDGNSLSLNASNQPLGIYEYQAYACQSTICGNKTPIKTVNVLPPAPGVVLNESNNAEFAALETTDFTATTSGTSVNDVKFYFSPVGDAGEYLLSNGILVGGQWQGTNTPQAGDYDVWARAWYYNSSLTQDSASVRIHVYARPGVPGNIVGPDETYDGSYLISWAAASGEYTRHVLEERFNGGAWTTLLDGNSLSLNASNQPLGTYEYQAYACQSSICGNKTAIKTVNVYTTPTVIMTQPSDGSTHSLGNNLHLEVQTSGAPVSQVRILFDGNNELGILSDAGNGLFTGDIPLQGHPGNYDARAEATYANGTVDSSTIYVNITSPVTTPGTPIIQWNNQQQNYTVAWGAISGATRYLLQEKVENGDWTFLPETTLFEATFDGQPPGTYHYRVIACQTAICSEASPSQSVTVYDVPAVTLVEPTNGGTYTLGDTINISVTTSGSPVNAVDIYVRGINDPVGSEGILTSLSPGTPASTFVGTHRLVGFPSDYIYFARASYGNNQIQDSTANTATVNTPIATPEAPQITGASPRQSYTVSWTNPPATAEYFFLLENSGDGLWPIIYQGADLSKTFDNQALGVYEYSVIACTLDSICSFPSPAASVTVVDPPSVTLIEPASGGTYTLGDTINISVTTSGTSVNAVDIYVRGINDPVGSEAIMTSLSPSVPATTFVGTHRLVGFPSDYIYFARATYGNNQIQDSTPNTATVNTPITTPEAPQITGANPRQSYTVSWPNPPATTEYFFLLENSGDGNWDIVYQGADLNMTFDNQTIGDYQYSIIACTLDPICSHTSPIAIVTVADPPIVTLDEPLNGSVFNLGDVVNFSVTTSGSNVSGVDIFFRGVNDPVVVENYLVSLTESMVPGVYTTLHTLTGFPSGYIYWARAKYGQNQDQDSGDISVTVNTPLTTPGQPEITSADPSVSYTVSWTDVPLGSEYFYLIENRGDGNWVIAYQGGNQSATFTNQADGVYQYSVIACTLEPICSEASPVATIGVGIVTPTVNLIAPVDGAVLNVGSNELIAEVSPIANVNGLEFFYRLQSDDPSARYPFASQNMTIESVDPVTDRYTLSIDASAGEFIVWAEVNYENNTLVVLSTEVNVVVQDGGNEIDCDAPEITCTVNTPPMTEIMQPPAEDLSSTSVGITAVEFRVDGSGGANLDMSVLTVPGTAGVVPSIGLSYTSHAGNGLVGQGWAISGLSMVSRCRQTKEQDGFNKGINFDIEDRFCLDGQRLMPLNALVDPNADYHDYSSVEYRTEIDSSVRVKAYGTTSGNPDYFKVWRPDGSITEYGNTTDSKQTLDDGGVLSWAQNRFEDNMGNPIVFNYINEFNTLRANTISYAFGANTSSSTYIQFEYEDRSDVIVGNIRGSSLRIEKRLKGISSYSDGVEVRYYALTYAPISSENPISHLESIQECSDSSSSAVCYSPTTFAWVIEHGFEPFFSQEGESDGYSRDLIQIIPIDIDGDGQQEFLEMRNKDREENDPYLYLSKFENDRLVEQPGLVKFFLPNNGNHNWHILDYNNDGRDDLMIQQEDGSWYIHVSDGNWYISTSWQEAPEVHTPFTSNKVKDSTQVMDFNGDGLPDLVEGNKVRYLEADVGGAYPYHFGAEHTIDLRTARENEPDYSCHIPDGFTFIKDGQVADFNTDGLVDVFVRINYKRDGDGNGSTECTSAPTNIYRWQLFLSDGEGNFTPYGRTYDAFDFTHFMNNNFELNPQDMKMLDMQGDGLIDIVYRVHDEDWYQCRNTGTDFSCHEEIALAVPNGQLVEFTDYNHDGAIDFLYPVESGNDRHYYVRLWNGNGYDFPQQTNAARNEHVATHMYSQFLDLNGDGWVDYFANDPSDSSNHNNLRFALGKSPHQARNVITQMTNGFGAETHITYKPLSDSSVYTRDWDAVDKNWGNGSPVFDVKAGPYVVSRIESSAPIMGNQNHKAAIEFRYVGSKMQSGGRGSLGFRQLITIDMQTNIKTTTSYRQDFPFSGRPAETRVEYSDGSLMNIATQQWDLEVRSTINPYIYMPVMIQAIETAYAGNSFSVNESADPTVVFDTTPAKTVTTETQFDDYGSPTDITVTTVGDGISQSVYTHNTYDHNIDDQIWHLARLRDSSVTTTRDSESQTRTSSYTYYPNGLLYTAISDPDHPLIRIETSYHYDAFGNKELTTVKGNDVNSDGTVGEEMTRSGQVVYDSEGQYVEQSYNNLGQLTQNVISRNNLGAVTEATDINGHHLLVQYDAFGVEYFRRADNGSYTITTKALCNGGCGNGPSNAYYKAITTTAGGSLSEVYFDFLGREVRTATRGFDGRFVLVDSYYDEQSRLISQSTPYYTGDPAGPLSETWYDDLGRIIEIMRADGMKSRISYQGFSVVKTTGIGDALIGSNGLTQTEHKNAIGELVSVEDHDGSKIEYQYDVYSNLTSMLAYTEQGVVETNIDYDLTGRKNAMQDPSMGSMLYLHNAFGDLRFQTNAKQETTEIQYDALGRNVLRTNKQSNGEIESQVSWVFDTRAYGNGLLSSVSDSVSGYQENIYYDALSRVSEKHTLIPGLSNDFSRNTVGDWLIEKATYDQYSRSFQSFDATGLDHGTEIQYNQWGYADRVVSAQYYMGSPVALYSTTDEMNALGKVTQETLGNGVTGYKQYNLITGALETAVAHNGVQNVQDLTLVFDGLGNLRSQINNSGTKNITEAYCYDNLNRLTQVEQGTTTASCGQAQYQYSKFGNILMKDTITDYQYGQNGASPFAVTTANGNSYTYDVSGNITDGDGRHIEYTTFNKPSLITKGTTSIQFAYGPGYSRYKRIDNNNGDITTTYYAANVEFIANPDGSKTTRRYIGGIAIESRELTPADEISQLVTQYIYTDHLGSTDVITDNQGMIVTEHSFDAFGSRRAEYSQPDSSVTKRGYTGHEQLDEVGLIHMNGRVYDPILGRFLSADPFIQAPKNTQSLNRYSYVLNNPLSYTDPSGYFSISDLNPYKIGRRIGRSLIRMMGPEVSSLLNSILSKYCGPMAPVCSAIGSYEINRAFGVPRRQAFKAAAISGVSTYVFQQINAKFSKMAQANIDGKVTGLLSNNLTGSQFAQKILYTAIAGGVMGKLQGGKFGHGFASAGLMQAAGIITDSVDTGGFNIPKIITSVIISGTISELTGGKFANGARSAAFDIIMDSIGGIGNDDDEGSGSGTTCTPNPIDIATGIKFLSMLDYEAAGAGGLKFKRYYNSRSKEKTALGYGWYSNFDKKLSFEGAVIAGLPWKVIYTNIDLKKIVFTRAKEGNGFLSGNALEKIQKIDTGWQLVNVKGTIESFNDKGRLITIEKRGGYKQSFIYNNKDQLERVKDSLGFNLGFTYNRYGLVDTMVDDEGNITHYRYDLVGQVLTKVIHPDDTESLADNGYKQFLYEDKRFPIAVTGIENELGQRLQTIAYDKQGRANLSELGNSAERVDIVFHDRIGNTLKNSIVRNSLGRETKYFFNKQNKTVSVEGHATKSCAASNQVYTYDKHGNIETETDWNGVATRYSYSDRNLEIHRVEAVGTAVERVVSTAWHKLYDIPTRIIEPGKITEFDYDKRGLLIKRTEIDTLTKRSLWKKLFGVYSKRSVRYQYNDRGLMTQVDGSLSGSDDVTTFVYDAKGNRTHVINALGHVSETKAFDKNGRPLLVVDANGTETYLTYNARGWLTSKTIKGQDGEATTQFEYKHSGNYDGQGQISKVILPNEDEIEYDYDAAFRLVSVHNSLGDRIEYTLDPEGNRIAEKTYSNNGELVRSQRRVFDELSRLLASIGADNKTITYQYDKNGNLTGVIDPLNNKTIYAFDGLNRLVATIDSSDGVITETYNVQGYQATVTDQRGLTTEYRYNGFGEKIAQISPDTGETRFEYNKVGQLVRQVDARDIEALYRYDLLGRIVHIHYPASSDDDIHYVYDQKQGNLSKTIGQLTQIIDPSGITRYRYNQYGQVVNQNYSIGETNYHVENHYNSVGQLMSVRYPSGRIVAYQHDKLGRINDVATQYSSVHQLEKVVSDIAYSPFGPLTHLDYGNGIQININRDQDYKIADIYISDRVNDKIYYDVAYLYDDSSNITAINDRIVSDHSQTFNYDELYRLVSAEGQYGRVEYDYDNVGNRLKRRLSGNDSSSAIVESYKYADDSNQLEYVSKLRGKYSEQRFLKYDSSGNVINDDKYQANNLALIYGANNRLRSVSSDNTMALYTYNAKGQRTNKTILHTDGSRKTTHFHYSSSGQLVAETDLNGNAIKEYLYVNNDRIAMIDHTQGNEGKLIFVHNDHLNTPKLMTDNNKEIVWQANTLPFGETVALISDVSQSLRFPGQYEDDETGYHYNYHRDYDPSLGRYIQSDPIGLNGGVNTFGYVLGNPIGAIDPFGLDSYLVSRPLNHPVLGSIGAHNFIVNGANSLGDPSATVISWGNTGDGTMGRVYAQGTPGVSSTTYNTDLNAWLSLASPTGDVTYRLINASDADVLSLALRVDEGQEFSAIPEFYFDAVNSNSAAGAVAHNADGGHALVAWGKMEPGASVAYRVGLNGQCVAP